MPDFSMGGANATLSFSGNTAAVRISDTAYVYGVNSTESHSRTERAFYPHRRSLGQFQITVDCIRYQEFRRFMNWLRGYADALLAGQVGTQKGATIMDVNMPSRNFHMVGVLVSGIDDHDHVGSMTFSPQLSFMLVKDYNDPGTAIVSTNSASTFVRPSVQDILTAMKKNGKIVEVPDASGSASFYPSTISSYKDTDTSIYDLPPALPPGVSRNNAQKLGIVPGGS